jgi:hypothetical protein
MIKTVLREHRHSEGREDSTIAAQPLKSHESPMTAIYNGLQFKTRLEARWAAFFDLAKWEWHVNPVPVGNWSPDFRVTFPCNHSECGGSHTLLVAVLPLSKVEDFKNHPCLNHFYGISEANREEYRGLGVSIDAGAAFGISPDVTTWEMSHGSGGGTEEVHSWVDYASALWAKTEGLVK